MRLWFSLIVFVVFGTPYIGRADAEESPFSLSFPLDCTLGTDCWIARYSDRDESDGKADYRCEGRTQNKHGGTDFTLSDLGRMREGVSVFAAAAGTVVGVRNDQPDVFAQVRGKAAYEGKECGNGTVINHGGGWTTQYCHLKQGSLPLKKGDSVNAGQLIGQIGLSGHTEYPHMHFSVRKDGERVDPFDGQLQASRCGTNTTEGLWETDIAYAPFALVSATLTVAPPTKETRWDAPPRGLQQNATSLVLTGRVFGSLKGDKWRLVIKRPDGSIFSERDVTMKKTHQFQQQYSGRKRPAGGFTPGVWTAVITVSRNQADSTIIDQKLTTSVLVK